MLQRERREWKVKTPVKETDALKSAIGHKLQSRIRKISTRVQSLKSEKDELRQAAADLQKFIASISMPSKEVIAEKVIEEHVVAYVN